MMVAGACLILSLLRARWECFTPRVNLDELRELLARHARPDQTTAIDGVLIAAVEQETPSLPSMSGTVLALLAQGGKRLASGDRVYTYRPGQYLIASVDLPVTGHFFDVGPGRPALGFGLTLNPSAVAELLLQAGPGDVRSAGTGAPSGLAVSDAPDDLLDAVVRLLRLLDRPRDIRVLAPLVIREILWRLITGEQGAIIRQLGLADSSLTHIARAVRWIRDHYAQSFRVEDVAQLSGMVIRDGVIANYHPYPPTPWNANPRDIYGTPGPYEEDRKNVV